MEVKRQATRVSLEGPIDQLTKVGSDYPRFGSDDEFIAASAIDISLGGMACESQTPIEPLSRVNLIFTLPISGEKRRVTSEGFVAHSVFLEGHCLFGIRFENLSPEATAAIDAYIGSG